MHESRILCNFAAESKQKRRIYEGYEQLLVVAVLEIEIVARLIAVGVLKPKIERLVATAASLFLTTDEQED